MAGSKYEYVKMFEDDLRIVPEAFFIVRVDGRGFSRFTKAHDFDKPNDQHGLKLMTQAARVVMGSFPEIILAYGQSDEYSFLFHPSTDLWGRRREKILTGVVSLFTSAYVTFWPSLMRETKLQMTPQFDGRVVTYPTKRSVRDYFSWRQVDCHVNNQYNTCYWLLVKSGAAPGEAYTKLQGTQTADKNELMFSTFGVNYNSIDPLFRKGTTIWRSQFKDLNSGPRDIIADDFWDENPHLLSHVRLKNWATARNFESD